MKKIKDLKNLKPGKRKGGHARCYDCKEVFIYNGVDGGKLWFRWNIVGYIREDEMAVCRKCAESFKCGHCGKKLENPTYVASTGGTNYYVCKKCWEKDNEGVE